MPNNKTMLSVLAALLLAAAGAQAEPETRAVQVPAGGFYVVDGVNVRNGNFSISYEELGLRRTYNSKSSHHGWFGLGWGSALETRLTVMPDQSVVVQTNGTGSQVVFGSPDAGAVRAGVERIVQAVAVKDGLNDAAKDSLRTQLLASRELRLQKVLDYGVQTTLAKNTELEVDARSLFANEKCPPVSLGWDGQEFTVRACRNNLDTYDRDGRLVAQMSDDGRPANAPVQLYTYQDGKLAKVSNDKQQWVRFKWQGRHVGEMENNSGTRVQYRYSDKGELLESKESGGLSYRLGYDGNANLTSITYIDDSKQIIRYDQSDSVVELTKRTGLHDTFEYRNEGGRLRTVVTQGQAGAEPERIVQFEFAD